MGKGKREAPREGGEYKTLRERLSDPFVDEGDLFMEKPRHKPPLSVSLRRFWDSGKGKILLAALCCTGILAGAVALALSIWIRPPELPNTGGPQQTGPIASSNRDPEEDAGPTDDELYPDDGYGGDMPTVSGDRKEGVYTFLLVGTDLDDGNTDTIMVVSYDTVNQDVNIMSIPRDTMINESWDLKKINSVYSRYSDGMGALKKRIQTLIGFQPDFYVKVDLGMFVELVDLIGGVEFDVPQDMNYDDDWQDLHIHLEAGLQTLDGEKAMELVRFRRYSEGDIKRVEVQQAFMKALIQECLSFKHWGKVKAYIDLAMENVQTDLEFGSVVWFAANVLGLNGPPALNMDDVYTCTLPGDYWGGAWSRSTGQEQSYVTIYPNQVVELVNERFNPYEQRVTTSMLDAMRILSNGDIASSTGSVRDSAHNTVMAVRRGEAYYDENGELVYGTPPEEEGLQEDDEIGDEEPLLPGEPGGGDEPFAQPLPGTDGGTGTGTGTNPPADTGTAPVEPEEDGNNEGNEPEDGGPADEPPAGEGQQAGEPEEDGNVPAQVPGEDGENDENGEEEEGGSPDQDETPEEPGEPDVPEEVEPPDWLVG